MSSSRPLEDSVQFLKGVGPARRAARASSASRPSATCSSTSRAPTRTSATFAASPSFRPGVLQTVQGEVVEIEGTAARRRPARRQRRPQRRRQARASKASGSTRPHRRASFRFGQRVAFSGKPKWYRDHWQMTTRASRPLDDAEPATPRQVVPVYPLTEDLRPEQLRDAHPPGRRPVRRRTSSDVLPRASCGSSTACPTVDAGAARRPLSRRRWPGAARRRRRFIYEEFLVLQLALALRRRELRDRQRRPGAAATPADRRPHPPAVPLRADRRPGPGRRRHRASDLASDRPMQRLLQADVGAGKTAVAVYALLVAVANKHQAALMAPTEVLARQHWHTLERYLAHSRVRRLLLTGGLTPTRAARGAGRRSQAGEIDLVVGTQALVQEGVEFARLGLVVIDEQHKFGVNQRARVRRLGVDPHYLVMTATPIPRTVALTVFGDLDVSIIRELPPGRQPVHDALAAPSRSASGVYEQLREALREGRQAYVVCPLVEESETLDVTAAEQTLRGAARRAVPRLPRRPAARPAWTRTAKDRRDGASSATAQLDLLVTHAGDRGRRRRAQRDADGDRARRALRPVAAAPAARPGQPRRRWPGECYLFAGADHRRGAGSGCGLFARTTRRLRAGGGGRPAARPGRVLRHAAARPGRAALRRPAARTRTCCRRPASDAFALVGRRRRAATSRSTRLLRQAVLDRYGQTLDLAEVG